MCMYGCRPRWAAKLGLRLACPPAGTTLAARPLPPPFHATLCAITAPIAEYTIRTRRFMGTLSPTLLLQRQATSL